MTVCFIRNDSPRYASPDVPTSSEAPSAALNNGRVGVCSRNGDTAPDAKSNFWSVALRHRLAVRLKAVDRNVTVHGELCGSSIQANLEGFENGASTTCFSSAPGTSTLSGTCRRARSTQSGRGSWGFDTGTSTGMVRCESWAPAWRTCSGEQRGRG
ncbi:Uncharacterized protein TCAP_05831 [Tolypocladium capitatum]|uniref:RNA ligase domain-containing protein n=1 Tax=Tolypocladium capitatum TaxID=45235 RepID=A0A2K3Q9K2_9HYPO|nr:Uncharacterized protein TCAP_05831 [Tolypocladium capitatum]